MRRQATANDVLASLRTESSRGRDGVPKPEVLPVRLQRRAVSKGGQQLEVGPPGSTDPLVLKDINFVAISGGPLPETNRASTHQIAAYAQYDHYALYVPYPSYA